MKLDKLILCVDIGYCSTGVALYDLQLQTFVYTAVIQTEKDKDSRVSIDNISRCQFLFKELSLLYERFKFTRVVAEIPHGGAKSSRAIMSMAFALAVLSCFIHRYKLAFDPVFPLQIKRLVQRKPGPVSKEMVQAYVSKRFGEHLLPSKKGIREHIADAMCLIEVNSYGKKARSN